MQCPACSKSAHTLLRYLFTVEGVSLSQALNGQLRCQQCRTLLQDRDVVKWMSISILIIILAVVNVALSPLTTKHLGVSTETLDVVENVLAVALYVIAVARWKYGRLEKVDEENEPLQKSTS
jgi:hypothetical protein